MDIENPTKEEWPDYTKTLLGETLKSKGYKNKQIKEICLIVEPICPYCYGEHRTNYIKRANDINKRRAE